jgi:hypothetical protein
MVAHHRENNVDYVTELENKVEELKKEVRELKSNGQGKKSSKAELQRHTGGVRPI